ncbi:MAG: DMT family transporter [Intrasporangium sp.]|uniref:EamA family transporter n=1 Tax=Intrasporangium sp. TaxID=1925024 RepID=UPI002649CC8C|nr:DMT family transporter [Intrasporangium sp.]MDN5797552.1 DMT family transporter [Intrasporangium sp.]
MSQRRPALGLGVALVSSAAFATSGAFAKSLLLGGWSPGAVVTLRIGIAALVLLVPTLLSLRGRWPLLRRNAPLVLGYGLTAVAGAQLAYFNAVTHLSVGVALLLEYLAPVLIVGWLWVRHRQAPRRLTLIGVALALLGLLLVLDLTGGARISAVGVAWGLMAAVCLVVYFLLSAKTADALPAIALAGSGLIVGAIVLGLAGATGILEMTRGASVVEIGSTPAPWWVPILVVSIVAAAFSYVAGVAAVRMLGAKVSSFVSLTEVLFAIIFAWLVLGELPMPVQLLGGALIIGGVVAVRADELRGVRARRAERHTDEVAQPATHGALSG